MNDAEETRRTGHTGHTRPTGLTGQTGPGGLVGPGGPVKSAVIPRIILPHGGYKKLIAYRKSVVVYLGTVVFCRRFLPMHGDRTVDQMIQAARSCKQNIAEGSSASGTSRESEIKLTNVARASLDELAEDYLDWLKRHGGEEWAADDPRRLKVRAYAREHSDWEDWQEIFETRTGVDVANLMLTLCHQTRFLLEKMIAAQEENFARQGGVRERMHAVRQTRRGEDWETGLHSRLEGAENVTELLGRAREIAQGVERMVWGIRRRRGWGGGENETDGTHGTNGTGETTGG